MRVKIGKWNAVRSSPNLFLIFDDCFLKRYKKTALLSQRLLKTLQFLGMIMWPFNGIKSTSFWTSCVEFDLEIVFSIDFSIKLFFVVESLVEILEIEFAHRDWELSKSFIREGIPLSCSFGNPDFPIYFCFFDPHFLSFRYKKLKCSTIKNDTPVCSEVIGLSNLAPLDLKFNTDGTLISFKRNKDR